MAEELRWKKGGRAPGEPLLIGAYGPATQRPRFLTGNDAPALWLDGAFGVEHVAVVGLEFFADAYQGTDGGTGILWLGGGGDLLIEDCLVRGYKDNVVVNGFGDTVSNVRIRACVVADAWSTEGHAQGLYAQEAEHVLIEACVFDHNGWREGVPGAEPTVFNHNVYVQTDCDDVDLIDCLVMNASSHGAQIRCAGDVQRCLFLANPIALLVGNGGETAPATTTIADNAVLFANDIAETAPRGMGIDLQNIASGQITGNILAQEDSVHPYGYAMRMHAKPQAPVHDVLFADNIVHEWRGGIKFSESHIDGAVIANNVIHAEDNEVPIVKHKSNPLTLDIEYAYNRYHSGGQPHAWFQVGLDVLSFDEWESLVNETGGIAEPAEFLDPWRSPATYQASIGEDPTLDAFIQAVRGQGRLTWDERYATPSILAYFRAGYDPAQ